MKNLTTYRKKKLFLEQKNCFLTIYLGFQKYDFVFSEVLESTIGIG